MSCATRCASSAEVRESISAPISVASLILYKPVRSAAASVHRFGLKEHGSRSGGKTGQPLARVATGLGATQHLTEALERLDRREGRRGGRRMSRSTASRLRPTTIGASHSSIPRCHGGPAPGSRMVLRRARAFALVRRRRMRRRSRSSVNASQGTSSSAIVASAGRQNRCSRYQRLGANRYAVNLDVVRNASNGDTLAS